MADITKTSRILSLVAESTNGDDRTISLANPITGISAANINSLSTYASDVLIDFQRFKSAKVINRTVINLDLSA